MQAGAVATPGVTEEGQCEAGVLGRVAPSLWVLHAAVRQSLGNLQGGQTVNSHVGPGQPLRQGPQALVLR